MVLTKGSHLLPFFGRRFTGITGLDPLRLQSPSIDAYQRLLPGLTNVTKQLRAYSFYCWLLERFAEQVEKEDPKAQEIFIRRAEWLLALIAVIGEKIGVGAVSGINNARRVAEKGAPYPIRESIYNKDGDTEGTYWKYPGGVLGQYYRNTMMQLGLMGDFHVSSGGGGRLFFATRANDKLSICGQDLAAAFGANVPADAAKRFLTVAGGESVGDEELLALGVHFNLQDIPQKGNEPTSEYGLLKSLVLGPDEPLEEGEATYLRRATIFYLLRFFRDHPKQGNDWTSFTLFAYTEQGGDDECLSGWYYYAMNEEYQFACTCIFSFLLERLRRQPVAWTVTDDFVRDAVTATLLELELLGLSFTSKSTLADLRDGAAYVELRDGTEDQIALRLVQLLELHRDNPDLTKVSDFSPSGGDSTEDVVGFLKELDSWWDQPLSEYLHYFFRYDILERHRRVALDKLRGRNQSSEKFVVEGGRLRFVNSYTPTHTGPRLDNALNFLRDLGWLDADGKTSTIGLDILENEAR